MNRRDLLSGLGGLTAAGLAGCVSDGAGGTGGDDERTPVESETGTAADELPGGPDPGTDENRTEPPPETSAEHEVASLTITDVECGDVPDDATVSFDRGRDEVGVTGNIRGSDLCKIPELADFHYDEQADELRVTITTVDRGGTESSACGQCIATLGYRLTASFETGLPESVRVMHRRDGSETVVATATRS